MLSRLPKIGAFTLLSLSIAACSSNNHNNNSIKPTPIPNSSSSDAEKAAAIEANRVALVAKAKAAGLTDAQATAYAAANKEADATVAQTALDNLVAEKLAAEKAAAEKAEAERLAKIEANRVALVAKAKAAGLTDAQATAYAAANKEADATTAQTALNNLVAAKLAAEKAEAERLAAEKAEQERLAAIEANRVALVAKAKAAGLTEAQATDYAAANKEASVEAAQTALDGIVAENKRIADKKTDLTAKAQTAGLDATRAQTFANNNVNTADGDVAGALTAAVANAVVADKGGNYTGSGLTNDTKVTSQEAGYGQITTPYGTTYTNYTKTKSSVNKTYNQPYSVVVGTGEVNQTVDRYNSYNSSTINTLVVDKVAGLATLDQNVPANGKAVYTGSAFSATSDNGKLNYLIDFDKRKGSGDIQGLSEFGTVKLQEGDLTKVYLNDKSITGVNGRAQANGEGVYTLGLFGPQADEVAGKAMIAQKDIGFGGQKDAKALVEVNRITLLAKAREAGLTDAQATAYADANKESTTDAAQIALNKIIADNEKMALAIEIARAKDISEATYPIGAITTQTSERSMARLNARLEEIGSLSAVYNQTYSVILGNYTSDIYYESGTGKIFSDSKDSHITTRGLKTSQNAIPNLGTATYAGKAFTGTYRGTYDSTFNSNTRENSESVTEGKLNYNVDFTNRTGLGSISGLGNTITLQQGNISGTGISATAIQSSKSGAYSLDFYGKEAEEIAGKVMFDGKDTVGFGGTRGEITK